MATTLIMLDYINEIVHPQGKLAGLGYAAQVRERGVLERAGRALRASGAAGHALIAVRVGFSADYRECSPSSPLFGSAKQSGALQLGTWATEFHADLALPDTAAVVTKHGVGAFLGTPLDLLLRNAGTDTVVLGGVATDLVVQTTARDAHDRGYEVVVLSDLCAAASPQEHEQALAMLAKVATITTSSAYYN